MSSRDFRERALQTLRGNWGMAVLTAFVASILGGLLVQASVSINLEMDEEMLRIIPEIVRTYVIAAFSAGTTLNFVHFILGGTVQLGYSKFLLRMHDNKHADVKDLFSEFDRFADGFLLRLLTGLYTALWMLLLIIPGFVAIYKYAMAPFIMQENPGMKPRNAIEASKQMMDGHKMELFMLDLSFIGWMLLNALTLGIGSFWLNPYMNSARAAFYRYLNPVPYIRYESVPTPDPSQPQNPWEQVQ